MEQQATVHELHVICRVRRQDVGYLRYTLEAYEGLCLPTTLPGGGGRVRLATSPEQRPLLAHVLAGLGEEIGLQVEDWREVLA